MKDSAHNSALSASLDSENSHSIASMVEGDAFSNAIEKVPVELWSLSEEELKAKAKPTKTDYALRIAFWNEVRIASSTDRSILPTRIFTNICSYQHWYSNVLNNPEKLAWLLCPVHDYEQSLKPLLVQIPERYNEILNLDIYDEKGKPVPAMVKLVLRAMEQVESRLLGSPIQRSENKNLNVVFSQPLETSEQRKERLERQIEELQRQRNGQLNSHRYPLGYNPTTLPEDGEP